MSAVIGHGQQCARTHVGRVHEVERAFDGVDTGTGRNVDGGGA